MTVDIRWLGAAGIELNRSGSIILIDPYLSRPGKSELLFRPLRPKKEAISRYFRTTKGTIRAIAVGHTHFDHALDIPEMARNLDCPVLGGTSLDALLEISGLPGKATLCRPQEAIALSEDSALTMIPSVHGLVISRHFLLEGNIRRDMQQPLRMHQFRLGEMHAPKIITGGITFLHIGSAGYLAHELEAHRCDVLFLCVPGWKNSPGYPDRVIDIVQPSCVVPIHYDDFTVPFLPGRKLSVLRSADLNSFVQRLKTIRSTLDIRILEPFAAASF
jgi:L-ascorbate metabolism protein UlaG (beta-lactamase superfamily)